MVCLFFCLFFFFATIRWTPVHAVIFYSQYGCCFSVPWCGSEHWEWYQQPDVCPRRLEYSAWRSVVFIFTLTDWITGWLTGRVATGTCSWLTDSQTEQLLADSLSHWLTDRLAGWPADRTNDWPRTGWLIIDRLTPRATFFLNSLMPSWWGLGTLQTVYGTFQLLTVMPRFIQTLEAFNKLQPDKYSIFIYLCRLVQCLRSPCVQLLASTYVCMFKIPNTGSHASVWRRENTALTDRNG